MQKFNQLEDVVTEAFKSFLKDLYNDPRLEKDIIHVTTLTSGLPTQRYLSQKLLEQGVKILPDLESSYSATIGIVGHSIFEALYRQFWKMNKYTVPEVPLSYNLSNFKHNNIFKKMVGTSDIIEIVKLDQDGTLVLNIRDWKTTKKYAATHKKEQLLNGEDVPWAYQLNIYKYMLEHTVTPDGVNKIKDALIYSIIKAVYKSAFFAHFNDVKDIDRKIVNNAVNNGISQAVDNLSGLIKDNQIIEQADKMIELVRKAKRFKVNDLGIIMILSDWSKSPWANRNTKETSPITTIMVPIMPDNRIKQFLSERLEQFSYPEKYQLTEEDLWIKLFALYDKSSKKILKTFTLKELKEFVNNGILSFNQQIIFIGDRYRQDPKKIKRCQYCSIKNNCGQQPAFEFIDKMEKMWHEVEANINKQLHNSKNRLSNNAKDNRETIESIVLDI